MEQPLVSIIMSVYNASQWLQQTIDSVLNQSYTNWEFIIIDDASKDGSKQILQQFDKDSRFRIIYSSENKGYVKNLNCCIDLANGKYIARLDADDICVLTRLEEQVVFLETKIDVALVCSFIDIIDENNNKIGEWELERQNFTIKKIKKTMPFSCCIAHPTVMIRTHVIKQFKYNKRQTNSDDWDLWLQLLAQNFIIAKITKVLLLYRKLNTSVTATSLQKSAFSKNNNTYQQYFALVNEKKQWNNFNRKVYFAYLVNKFKLFLSKIYHGIKH
jgi:glycosyltransferase involved in cell wall biosynthesis